MKEKMIGERKKGKWRGGGIDVIYLFIFLRV